MDALTRFLAPLFPGLAARRVRAQAALKASQRYYDAVAPSPHRPRRGGSYSADAVMDRARGKLREYARWLDENHDLVIGILNDLEVNIIGSGVGIEPMARRRDGSLDDETNEQLRDLWRDFWEWPEATGELSGDELDRLLCRSWLRDGEVFIHHLLTSNLRHRTRVPYTIEALEADFVPFDLTKDDIVHGVRKNAFGAPLGFYVYKHHPGDRMGFGGETKYVRSEFMTHVKFARRLHQTRGVSILHGVLTRLDDVKDYEESERIAARIAAAMTGYIKRNGEYLPPESPDAPSRTFEMEPGLIFDSLEPGEDVGMIRSDRPNSGLESYRNSQLRAVAAGTSNRFSSVAKNYNGTYSAQRQELVEGSLHTKALFNAYKHQCKLPVWHRFMDVVRLNGLVRLSPLIEESSLYRPEVRQTPMPWIDPLKELKAFQLAVECGFRSRAQVIRDMGGDPREVDAQLAADTFIPQTAAAQSGQHADAADHDDDQDPESTAVPEELAA